MPERLLEQEDDVRLLRAPPQLTDEPPQLISVSFCAFLPARIATFVKTLNYLDRIASWRARSTEPLTWPRICFSPRTKESKIQEARDAEVRRRLHVNQCLGNLDAAKKTCGAMILESHCCRSAPRAKSARKEC